jgi:hypothetical protein
MKGPLTPAEKRVGFLQLARYSRRALEYLDACFRQGENGQDEMITFSLLNRAKMKISQDLLAPLIRGVWTWQDKYVHHNVQVYQHYLKYEKYLERPVILHPVR